MKVAVLGGRLQGVEIAYLAGKAGWQVIGVDRDAAAPIAGLCQDFRCFDLMESDQLTALLHTVDFAIPALEDQEVLDHISLCAARAGVRLAYDRQAYLLSSSKRRSDILFAVLGIPAPKPWPFCGFPLTIKPVSASGSKGVCCFDDADQFEQWLAGVEHPENWVKQEFLTGPSYSIEVIGDGEQYRTFEITELEVDAGFDCKRVLAPVPLSKELAAALEDTALTLARSLRLTGIMDVEVILHQGQLKVLEIDARFPSQTPTVVYHSSGINLVEALWHGDRGGFCSSPPATARGVVYEHILVEDESLSVCGEHIMAGAGPLDVHHDFFGAQEALTNYRPGRTTWVATLIMVGQDLGEALSLRETILTNIRQACGITTYSDTAPQVMPQRKQQSIAA